MPSQLFKEHIPYIILMDFLSDNCIREGKFYIFSKACFRKALYYDNIKPFCQSVSKYYHLSKKYYVERNMDYSRFTTVIRQLCKLHNVPYMSKIVYNKMTYDIIYYIDMSIDISANNTS
jgi:hypothetical protein